jgi:hypothetical protein
VNEIVGAKIGSIITNNTAMIAAAVKGNTISEFIDRDRMQFMSSLDLGQRWDNMANSKTLFLMDENGKIHPPNNAIKPTGDKPGAGV